MDLNEISKLQSPFHLHKTPELEGEKHTNCKIVRSTQIEENTVLQYCKLYIHYFISVVDYYLDFFIERTSLLLKGNLPANHEANYM